MQLNLIAKVSRGHSWTHFYNTDKYILMVDDFVFTPTMILFEERGIAFDSTLWLQSN